MTRFSSFDALASRYSGGRVSPPRDGEPAGDRCPLCHVQPVYRQNERGIWRIHMVHGPHRPAGPVTPDLLPPRRPHWTDDDAD